MSITHQLSVPEQEGFMRRCFELAQKGLGAVSPNPLVGCVIVYEGKIIGEGFHRKYGEAHAEPDAIQSVADKEWLIKSSLFVNLEPCAHHGKTPPCVDLILAHQIPEVYICNTDPFEKVNGQGIEKLRKAGVKVNVGILEQEGRSLNRRFFTFVEKKRPYIILKWAQTTDGYIDKIRAKGEKGSFPISCKEAQILNHQWRSEEDAILIGTRTAQTDNPALTTRHVRGKNPVRVLIDQNLQVPRDSKIFNEQSRTIIFNQLESRQMFQHLFVQLYWRGDVLQQICDVLYQEKIASLIVEGGAETLQRFMHQELWDEIRIIISPDCLHEGLKAPEIENGANISVQVLGKDQWITYVRQN
ncbi:MAG: bifunctional diaminohydroxyphosphoribosylaminopyrimidine deaminase/5-amino-6-(5-phosphoribosylamino)uracil reductase RibD [Flavobacteriales bacterium]